MANQKPQPYQVMLNGCASACGCMVLMMFLLLGLIVAGAILAPKTNTEVTSGR